MTQHSSDSTEVEVILCLVKGLSSIALKNLCSVLILWLLLNDEGECKFLTRNCDSSRVKPGPPPIFTVWRTVDSAIYLSFCICGNE